MNLYEIQINGHYQYLDDKNQYQHYLCNTLNIVANNVEEAKEKIEKNIWKFIEGCSSEKDIKIIDMFIIWANILNHVSIN